MSSEQIPMTPKERLSILIRRIKRQKGYSQRLLAKKLEVTQSAIRSWENAQCLPDTDNWPLIAREAGYKTVSDLAAYIFDEKKGEEEDENSFDNYLNQLHQLDTRRLAQVVNCGSNLLSQALVAEQAGEYKH